MFSVSFQDARNWSPGCHLSSSHPLRISIHICWNFLAGEFTSSSNILKKIVLSMVDYEQATHPANSSSMQCWTGVAMNAGTLNLFKVVSFPFAIKIGTFSPSVFPLLQLVFCAGCRAVASFSSPGLCTTTACMSRLPFTGRGFCLFFCFSFVLAQLQVHINKAIKQNRIIRAIKTII